MESRDAFQGGSLTAPSSLTSRERVLHAIRRQPLDRIPVGPTIADSALFLHGGMTVREFATDARKMLEAQLRAFELAPRDIIFVGCDNYYIAEGFGCGIAHPEDELPYQETAPVSIDEIERIYDLEVPDPSRDGRMGVFLEVIARLRQELGDTVAIRSSGTGPTSLASYLVGTQDFLTYLGMIEADLGGNEEAIRHAFELAAEALIAFHGAALAAGADILHCGDSLASLDMISPRMYEKYAWAYEKKVIEADRANGGITLLHICGNMDRVIPLMGATGADLVEIDHKTNLARAKKLIGETTCLIGNVDPVTIMLEGSVDEIRQDCLRCIESAGSPNGGFILGTGCHVARSTPAESLRIMTETAWSYPIEQLVGR
jgi:uroporphyrinogen decarboxylase